MFQTKKFTSGLTLLTARDQTVPSVSACVLIGAGSRYEDEKTNGLAHFLEHMLFQGNKKWPTKLALSTAVDEIGAEYNGMTAKEYTGYYVKAESKHLKLCLDVLSQMVCHSLFAESQIEREKPVIIEEMNYRDDNPQIVAGDRLMELMFSGNPLGLTGVGEKTAVQSFKKADFLNFYQNHYGYENVVVVIAGNFSQSAAEKMTEEKFANLPVIKAPAFKKFVPVNKIKDKIVIREKDTDQNHLMLGLHALERNSPQRYVQSILNTILGSGISSRMFQKIREEKSLAYYVDTDIDVYKDTGLFTVSAGVNKEKLEEAVASIISELEKIKKPGDISDKELRKAKDNLRGHLVLRLEESLDRAMFFGLQLVLENKTRTLEEIIAGIENVTVSDVSNLANKLFQPDRYHLSLVGKNIDRKKMEKVLA